MYQRVEGVVDEGTGAGAMPVGARDVPGLPMYRRRLSGIRQHHRDTGHTSQSSGNCSSSVAPRDHPFYRTRNSFGKTPKTQRPLQKNTEREINRRLSARADNGISLLSVGGAGGRG